jgi:hypothetical protein
MASFDRAIPDELERPNINDDRSNKRSRANPDNEPEPDVVAPDTSAPMDVVSPDNYVPLENDSQETIGTNVSDMTESQLNSQTELPTEQEIVAIENQLLEPVNEEGDNASAATGPSTAATSLSAASNTSIETLANSVISLSSSGFTMAPSAEDLATDFYTFWNENPNVGFTAVMIAFLSFAYSKGIDATKIASFFNSFRSGVNLRGPVAQAITESVRDISETVVAPGGAAGGSMLTRISNGITGGIRAVAVSLVGAMGANMLVEEPLTIDNVTDLLFSAGEYTIDTIMTVPDFISQLKIKIAALKALYRIKTMRGQAISAVELTDIDRAVIDAGLVLNDATGNVDKDISSLKGKFNKIINKLTHKKSEGASDDRGAGSGRGGKRQSQKKQKKQQQQKKQKQQKKTQKQSHKKLSKSKRAKKAKQSKKANKKH